MLGNDHCHGNINNIRLLPSAHPCQSEDVFRWH